MKTQNKRPTRTERLVRRLCEMLQLDIELNDGNIRICPKNCSGYSRSSQTAIYKNWRQCLFGNRDYFGLCEKGYSMPNSVWKYADDHIISFTNLDELEMKLAVLGYEI